MTVAFVTGISGQDGSYLTDRLVDESVEVHGLVRSVDSDAVALLARHPNVHLHKGDLADLDRLSGLIREVKPDEVYNLGGISSVAQSWAIPAQTGVITGVSVANLLEAVHALDAPVRFLQASSSEIFGSPSVTPQDETTAISPTSPYGAAKAYAHTLVHLYRSRGVLASNCILYNHESPRRPETFVTRKITAGAARIAAGLQETLELGDLTVARDWGWAPDFVDAMVRANRHEVADDYVIATGEAHTVEEFVAAAFAAVGIDDWKPLVRINPAFIRPMEISKMLGNPDKARRQLGWTPTVSFTEIVTRMAASDREALAS